MAYTREEYINLLKEIGMSGGDTPKMMGLLQKLRDDYDEREGMLKRYNETVGTTPIEGKAKATEEDNPEDGGERRDPVSREEFERLKADYDNMRRSYVDRFFGEDTDVVEQEEPTPEVTNFDDLFK